MSIDLKIGKAKRRMADRRTIWRIKKALSRFGGCGCEFRVKNKPAYSRELTERGQKIMSNVFCPLV